MKKTDLTVHVATEASMTKAQASGVVDAVLSAISDSLARDESVAIAGFGTFSTKTRGARQGRNPRTGESIAIAASKSPTRGARAGVSGTCRPNVVARTAPRRLRPSMRHDSDPCGRAPTSVPRVVPGRASTRDRGALSSCAYRSRRAVDARSARVTRAGASQRGEPGRGSRFPVVVARPEPKAVWGLPTRVVRGEPKAAWDLQAVK